MTRDLILFMFGLADGPKHPSSQAFSQDVELNFSLSLDFIPREFSITKKTVKKGGGTMTQTYKTGPNGTVIKIHRLGHRRHV